MKLIFVTLAATLTGTTAFAGGFTPPAVEQPVLAPAAPVAPIETGSDWTGGYVGLQYGQGDADSEVPDITVPATPLSAEFVEPGNKDSLDLDGYGIHGGYIYDLGQFVLGGELDYNRLDFDQVDEDKFEGDLWRLRGRAGYDLGRWLPYATLGVANISIDSSEQGQEDISETGVTYGIGVDFKVTEKFTVGAEYSRQSFTYDSTFSGVNYEEDIDVDLIQIRGAYHF